MNIAIIGNGRNFAILQNLWSKFVKNFFSPGNAGTASIGNNMAIDILDFNSI